MTPDSDLDAGLDAGLETYPRRHLVALVVAPWLLLPPEGPPAAAAVLTVPVLWLLRPWRWRR